MDAEETSNYQNAKKFLHYHSIISMCPFETPLQPSHLFTTKYKL